MSKVTFFSRRSVVAVSACPVFWGMDLCNMLSRQILQMVAMGLASREVAGRSTFSMSLQGLLTPCLKRASFFFSLPSRLCPLCCEIVGHKSDKYAYRFSRKFDFLLLFR